MTLPITVVIATQNRWHDLEQTLTHLACQDVAGVVVVDDGSTDETHRRLAVDFPDVVRVRNETSRGVPAFGDGVAAVSTPYAFLLDDDATPAAGCLERTVAAFEADEQTAVVACHICLADGAAVTASWPAHPACFWGCGAGLRVAALAEEPYLYDPRLRLHGTEMDLAVRLYDRGHVVRYVSDAIVVHRVSALNRSASTRVRSLTSGAVWFPVKHLPWAIAAPGLLRHIVFLGVRSWRRRLLSAFVLGLVDAARELRNVLAERKPVRPSVARFYRDAVWEYEPVTSRLARAVWGRPDHRGLHPVSYGAAGTGPSGRSGRTVSPMP